ncbi:MAG TPA: RsmE family RNA methyltransferase [Chitinophagaceae bacterium]
MSVPFFYISEYNNGQKEIELDEDSSRHVVQVLRMQSGEKLNLTDGKGNLITAEIINAHKKYCSVRELVSHFTSPVSRKVTIAISLLKNASRFEWFLEKATEIGITEIIPLLCERTEKEKFRFDRMKGICVSAMLQSQQVWLPVLHEPKKFEDLEIWKCADGSNFIAHCTDDKKQELSHLQTSKSSNLLIAIGPEGDFTNEEIALALQHNFIPVSLGETRLRTETAGIVAAVMLAMNRL